MDNSTPATEPVSGVAVESQPETVITENLPKWYKDLPEHLVNGVSKFESPEALAEGYVNAQKLIGKRTQDLSAEEIKSLLTPEEIAEAFLNKGVPKTVEEYELPILDQFLKPEISSKLKTVAHENGVSPKGVEALVEFHVKQQQADMEATREAWRNQVFAEYGNNLSKELEYAQRAIAEFGGDEIKKELDQTGLGDHPMVIKLFSRLGKSMMEDSLPSMTEGSGSNKNNKLEIQKLLSDPGFMRKWKAGDKTAVAQLNALYES